MTQRYEPAVQEDLNVGVDACFVAAPLGGELRAVRVGLHTVARGQRAYEAAWTPGAILTTGNASTTVSVPDAAEGDFVLASHDKILTGDLRITGHVSEYGIVKVVVHNPTGTTVTVPAGTVGVIVFPFIGVSTDPAGDPPVAGFSWEGPVTGGEPEVLDVQFTDTSTGEVTSWAWDFGDSGSSTEQHPLHVYATRGPYTVVLTVTGPGGSDDETQIVDMSI